MAAKRYISNVFVDNADDLFRLKRGKRRKIRMRSSGGGYWTRLKALFITQDEYFIITEDDKNIVTEPYTE